MVLEILVLRAFREHSNQTLHSNHLKFVCCFLNIFHTTGGGISASCAEIISRALQSNTSLTSLDIPCVLFIVLKHLSHTTDNHFGDSGAESISRALQSNTSLTSLDIRCMLFC